MLIMLRIIIEKRLNILTDFQQKKSAGRDLSVFLKKDISSYEERSRLEQLLANLEMH